ncbi:hypothetical protein HDV04_006229 [Boothiomyces sp. JEL0838]|nr:hypothetical protein HDV04_006229 [Boothiomyces sp. JEL0838]
MKENEFRLEGLERFVTINDDRSVKIAHISVLYGNPYHLAQLLPKAFMNVINKHPKMRTIAYPHSTKVYTRDYLDYAEAGKLVTTIDMDDWQDYVLQECKVPFQRTREIPFKLSLVIQSEKQSTLILFSDHYMSDGHSGLIILNDILENIRDECIPLYELKRTRSFFSSAFSNFTSKLLDNKLVDYAISGLAMKTFTSFKSCLPLISENDVNVDKAVPKSFGYFESGSFENLQQALNRCRQEETTLNAAVMILLAIAAGKISNQKEVIQLAFDIDYNMRGKVEGITKEDVGFNVAIGSLESFLKGLDVNEKFWEAAKRLRKESLIADKSLSQKLNQVYSHRNLHSLKTVPTPNDKCCINDLNLSNIGRYPFETVVGNYKIKNIWVYNNMPYLGPAFTFFLTSTENINYSCVSRVENTSGKKLFDYAVSLVENIHTLDSEITVKQVLERLE